MRAINDKKPLWNRHFFSEEWEQPGKPWTRQAVCLRLKIEAVMCVSRPVSASRLSSLCAQGCVGEDSRYVSDKLMNEEKCNQREIREVDMIKARRKNFKIIHTFFVNYQRLQMDKNRKVRWCGKYYLTASLMGKGFIALLIPYYENHVLKPILIQLLLLP